MYKLGVTLSLTDATKTTYSLDKLIIKFTSGIASLKTCDEVRNSQAKYVACTVKSATDKEIEISGISESVVSVENKWTIVFTAIPDS